MDFLFTASPYKALQFCGKATSPATKTAPEINLRAFKLLNFLYLPVIPALR